MSNRNAIIQGLLMRGFYLRALQGLLKGFHLSKALHARKGIVFKASDHGCCQGFNSHL